MKPLDLLIEPSVHEARKQLPGNVRHRIRLAIASLADDPRSAETQPLDVTGIDVPAGVEFRRLRLDRWRLVYAVHDEEGWVWVMGLYRRPPYDYDDLRELATRLGA
jgi:mRNA interferase RelE/StbE